MCFESCTVADLQYDANDVGNSDLSTTQLLFFLRLSNLQDIQKVCMPGTMIKTVE